MPAAAQQQTLYDNGPDGDIGYYHTNFGSVVTNSFVLRAPATLTNVALTIYTVDDGNYPQRLKWTVTTEPLGGSIVASGFTNFYSLGNPYITKFLFFAWPVAFSMPRVALPAGTYYLQIQDVTTLWDTWAFWAESGDGVSSAYYQPVDQDGTGPVSQIHSESFSILGEWRLEHSR